MENDDEPVGSESDGLVRNLGADLPEADGIGFASDDEPYIEIRPQNKAFAVIDKRQPAPVIPATRKSTGKLTRPSRPSERPVPARGLAHTAPNGQRKLKGPARDPMTFDESPRRPVLLPRAAQPAQFSPTRKRKRQAEALQQTAADPAVDDEVPVEQHISEQESDAAPGASDQEVSGQEVSGQEVSGQEVSGQDEALAREPPPKRRKQRRENGTASRRSTRLHHPTDEDASPGHAELVEQVEDKPHLKPGPVANLYSLYPEGDTTSVEVKKPTVEELQTVQRRHAATSRVARKEKPRRDRTGQPADGGAQVGASSRATDGPARGSSRGEGSKVFQQPREAARPGPSSSRPAMTEDDTIVDERDDALRLYDQESRLTDIYSALDDIGWSHREGVQYKRAEIDLEDPEVMRLKKLCRKARKKLKQPSDVSNDLPCMEELGEIEDGLQDLDSNQAYFKSKTKMKNIYFYLVPSLVRLLREAIRYFHANDNLASARSSITIDHVHLVVQLMRPIVNLRSTLEKYLHKPDGLNLKLPVRNGILLPLNRVRVALQGVVASHDRREEQARQRAQDAVLAAEREERWVEEEEEARRRRDQKRAWQQLHIERRGVEYIIDSVAKLDHLAVPPLVDIDHNGEIFERISLFTTRVGPPPSKTTAARGKIRSDHELEALQAGLKAYAGPRVYQHIFSTYCIKHGVLNDWSVTEIVTMAADIVAVEKREQMREKGYVDDWVEQIPLWTAPNPRLLEQAQENQAAIEGPDHDDDEWMEM